MWNQPEGGEVFLDGRLVGTTPVDLVVVTAPGTLVVSIEGPGVTARSEGCCWTTPTRTRWPNTKRGAELAAGRSQQPRHMELAEALLDVGLLLTIQLVTLATQRQPELFEAGPARPRVGQAAGQREG